MPADAKLKEVTDQIAVLTKDAQSKWQVFDQKRKEFAESGEDANNTESESFKSAHEAHEQYGQLADKITDLEKVREGLWAMTADSKSGPEPAREMAVEAKDLLRSGSLADQALGSAEYKELKQKGLLDGSRLAVGVVPLAKQASADEFKALLVEGAPATVSSQTNAGALFRPERVGYFPLLERPLMLTDLVTLGTTQTNAVEYVKQTSFTNNAAPVAEAVATGDGSGAKPESAMAFSVVQAAVRTIAHWIPATRNALADAGQLRTIIEEQLRYGLAYVLDAQMVNGDGTGQNLTGLLNQAGIGTQAKGADTPADAIHKALTIVRLQYVEPNAVALHPTDWQTLRLSKDSQGNYLYGPPALAGDQQIWGKPVVTGAQFPQGTGVVADFRQAMLWLRDGVQVLASDSHSDFFTRNLVAVLAEMRAAFGVVRPQAVCTVTGL
jgi:HK97 family phage major capsid protein